MRIQTLPGKEAQVYFDYLSYTTYRGKRRKTWVFNIRLSYSRLDYYEIVYDQRPKLEPAKYTMTATSISITTIIRFPSAMWVEINLTEKLLRISYQGKEISTHPSISGKGNFYTCKSHYPAYKCYCDTEYQDKYQVKMVQIGRYTEQLFFLILKEHPRDWNRPVIFNQALSS